MENKIESVFKNKFFSPLLIIGIFLVGFVLRLYRFDNPIADWHSWRQADTSAVSRIFVEKGFDILQPRYLDISNIQTGKNNPQGLRLVEFPLYNIFQAGLYKIVGILTLEEWGRLVSIFASLLSSFFLFKITKKYFGNTTAYFSLLFFLFLPYSIYYSRTILPDTLMVTASIGGIYFFDLFLSKTKNKYLYLMLATLFTASSFLLKPYALFFALPQIILAWQKTRIKMIIKPELWIHLILSVVPLILWRLWISQFPEGIPASIWLLNGNNIRFRPSFFRWIFYERLTKLIGGYVGIIFGAFGLIKIASFKKNIFALSFLVSSLLYLVIFATGNVQHDYYQILIIPTVALFFGLGAAFLWQKGLAFRFVVICIALLSFYFGWQQVKDYFNINNPSLVIAGEKADKILPKNAKVIVPYDGDTTPLYYVNRFGWPAFQDSAENLKKIGATHLVFVKPLQRDIDSFGKKYKIIAQSSDYLILEL